MLTTEFLFAGKASFVVANPKGETVTIQLRKGRETINRRTGEPFPPAFFLKLRHGNGSWDYIGMVDPITGDIRKTQKSMHVDLASRPVKVAKWAISLILTKQDVPTGYRMEHTGRCGRCGRMLRDEDSIKRGLGPDCAGLR